MPPTSPFLVRIWRPLAFLPAGTDSAADLAARAVDAQDATAATVEADGGDGAVIAVATRDDVHLLRDDVAEDALREAVIRTWRLEEEGTLAGAADLPDNLLGELYEGLFEDDDCDVRLLTAEEPGVDGRSYIRAVRWYDRTQYARTLSEDE